MSGEWPPESPEQPHCYLWPSPTLPQPRAATQKPSSHRPRPPAAPALRAADTKQGITTSSPAAQQPVGLIRGACRRGQRDYHIDTLTVWGCKMVQHEKQIWFHQRNDIKADVVVHQTALKEDDPRKYL